MVNGKDILRKLTVRNVMALATTGVFLWSIVYSVMNIAKVAAAIEGNSTIALLVGVFITIVPMVYIFYFRKTQAKPEVTE